MIEQRRWPMVPTLKRAVSAFATILAVSSPALAAYVRVSIFAPDGSPSSAFTASPEDFCTHQVKVGPDGNLWIARDHCASGDPRADVAVFALDGTPISTIPLPE